MLLESTSLEEDTVLAEWSYPDTHQAEQYCQLQYFGFKKVQADGDVEFIITVREYIKPPDPAMRFFAHTDKQTNQRTAPFTPVGWGGTLSDALSECIKAIRRFPYEA
jgi:hypothetical protein